MSGGVKIVYVAAAALINAEGKILLAKRPEGKSMAGLWEFPGGKIEQGETPEVALARELKEELSLDINPNDFEAFTFASHSYDNFHLLMPLYLVRQWLGSPKPIEGQTLAWVDVHDLHTYPAPAADIPLFDFIVRHL